jgi:hypothetical protein
MSLTQNEIKASVVHRPAAAIPVEPRVIVSHDRGKALQVGCSHRDCQQRSHTLKIRENGDVVFEHRDRHDKEWHWNSRSLREMIETLATHDLQALKNLLGPDLIRKLAS